ncbi:hypothetical protein QYE76_048858 [Lolium multiflorum]|uniref:Uncharacterized protein n=1 Tax=Lolium multiflorum TaxID=4521 RepID=A0AAD8WFS7_LOLMU|nr:hypothetical protein QYE76_048858 [Lolium multiflorum]
MQGDQGQDQETRRGNIVVSQDRCDGEIKRGVVDENFGGKKEMMEAKAREKEATWTTLREDAKRKADIEERRAHAEEHRAMAELIAAENATMMMNGRHG